MHGPISRTGSRGANITFIGWRAQKGVQGSVPTPAAPGMQTTTICTQCHHVVTTLQQEHHNADHVHELTEWRDVEQRWKWRICNVGVDVKKVSDYFLVRIPRCSAGPVGPAKIVVGHFSKNITIPLLMQ